jgi:hypothetical protein
VACIAKLGYRDVVLKINSPTQDAPTGSPIALLPSHPNMTNLDMLLLKGPSSGNIEEGLGELRYTILTQGIPANSEGMVRYHPSSLCPRILHSNGRLRLLLLLTSSLV